MRWPPTTRMDWWQPDAALHAADHCLAGNAVLAEHSSHSSNEVALGLLPTDRANHAAKAPDRARPPLI